MRRPVREGVRAGLVAGAVSGLPSTAFALLRGDDPLAATRAAGALLLPRESRAGRLVVAAVPVHLGLSLGWGIALAQLLPRRRTVGHGVVAGVAIAALDLGVVGRRHARISALPVLPQLADHVAFGAVVGAALARDRRQA
jgi:hypothetical protein